MGLPLPKIASSTGSDSKAVLFLVEQITAVAAELRDVKDPLRDQADSLKTVAAAARSSQAKYWPTGASDQKLATVIMFLEGPRQTGGLPEVVSAGSGVACSIASGVSTAIKAVGHLVPEDDRSVAFEAACDQLKRADYEVGVWATNYFGTSAVTGASKLVSAVAVAGARGTRTEDGAAQLIDALDYWITILGDAAQDAEWIAGDLAKPIPARLDAANSLA